MSQIPGGYRQHYSATHAHRVLRRDHPKTGVCEQCGRERGPEERPFHYAFLKHPEPHTTNREDYREMCMACHVRHDIETGQRPASLSEDMKKKVSMGQRRRWARQRGQQ